MKTDHGTMPDFLCIGFQKSGTSTLYDLLACHPQLALARDVKEPMFYRVPAMLRLYWPWRKKFYSRRYYGHLALEDPRQVGEVNAGLSFNGCAEMLTRDFDPSTKLFFLLRNPTERAYSAFKYFCALGFLPMRVIREDLKCGHAEAFDRYCRSVLQNPRRRERIMKKRMKYLCFSQGNYADLIEEYAAFPHRHYILFEEFVGDQRGVCEALYDFLEVSCPEEGIPYGLKINGTTFRAVSPRRAKWRQTVKGLDYILDEFFAMGCWCPKLYGKYRGFTRRMLHACTAEDDDRSPMRPETRALLEDYYRDQKDRTAALLGRNLDDIWFA